ncbi:AAA family ATPase, partial [Vibrio sp. 811]
MKRINVIGSSGSGKSTFAKALAQKLDVTHIEMDKLFWPFLTSPQAH